MREAAILIALMGCQPPAAQPPEPAPPEIVAVDWHGRGTPYAARVIDRREGLTRVVFADGDHEWVEPARLRPWPASLAGRRISFWSGRAATHATVARARGSFFEVRLDDRSTTWISRDMIHQLEVPPAAPERPAQSFPARPSADPSTVRAGAHVLAYWSDNGARPWVCEVVAVSGSQAMLRYSDGSNASVDLGDVVRVFERGGAPRPGERVWLASEPSVGVVRQVREDLVQVIAHGEERWIEAEQVVALAPAVDPARLVEGALVTALWQERSPYHATIVARAGDRLRVAWHDGTEPSEIPVADVLETWTARAP